MCRNRSQDICQLVAPSSIKWCHAAQPSVICTQAQPLCAGPSGHTANTLALVCMLRWQATHKWGQRWHLFRKTKSVTMTHVLLLAFLAVPTCGNYNQR